MTLPPEDRDLIERVLGVWAFNAPPALYSFEDVEALLAAVRAEAAPVVDEEALRQAFMSGCGTGAEADPAWHEDTIAEYRAAGWEAYRAALEAALTQPNGGQDQ